MQRREFLTLLLLASGAAADPEALLRGWFWLRWENELATLEYSAWQPAHGPLHLPDSLQPLPAAHGRSRARGKLAAPVRRGPGDSLVTDWPRPPRVLWLEERDGSWAYRLEEGSLKAPGLGEFQAQNLGLARAVIKANQEAAGAFSPDSAGEMLGWKGKSAIVVAPAAWTRSQFVLPGHSANVVAFLEVRL